MENDPKPQEPANPNPVDDLRNGFALLFRAAKTAASQLPKSKLETAVLSGARELGRAVEEVAHSIESQLFGSRRDTKRTDSEEPSAPEGGDARKDEARKGPKHKGENGDKSH